VPNNGIRIAFEKKAALGSDMNNPYTEEVQRSPVRYLRKSVAGGVERHRMETLMAFLKERNRRNLPVCTI